MRGFQDRMEVSRFQALVRERVPVPECGPAWVEQVPLAACAGRILAEAVRAAVNVPAFVRSSMDGYALRSEETFGAGPYNPLKFRVIGEVTPGREFAGTVGPGEAVRIMTGAPLPDGADAVLIAENAREAGGVMEATDAVPPGKNTGRIAEDIRQGDTVLAAGRCLRPQDVGVLASIGTATVRVRRQPRVTLLITGNELLKPGQKPHGAMIVDSNSLMLEALVRRDGGAIGQTLHLPDDRGRIGDALVHAPGDVLVMTGGTSVGVEDHGPVLIAELGALLVHGVAMRPSAPTGFGWVANRPVFLLPGNPVSCLAAYDFFVGLAVRRMGGRPDAWPYRQTRLPLRDRITSQIGRVDYARVRIESGAAVLIATSGASVLSSTTQADGFVVVPQDSEGYAAGATVDIWLYD
jgi:molybdopterin molybdotransferase